MRRIRAYTIIEMLVVMIISSISIGITYTCYTIFSNHYLDYKRKSDELAQYILLDKLLTKDISASKIVKRSIMGIECLESQHIIYYDFYDNYILRRMNSGVDTIDIKSKAYEYKKMDKLENIPGALVNEVTMTLIYKDENLNFHYNKKYGADMLMSMEEEFK